MFIHRESLPHHIRAAHGHALPEYLPVSIVREEPTLGHLRAWLIWIPAVSMAMILPNFVSTPEFLQGPQLPSSRFDDTSLPGSDTFAISRAQPGECAGMVLYDY